MSQVTKEKAQVVLALFPNGRGMGLAVMKDALTLVEAYTMAVKKKPTCNMQLLERVKEKLEYYEPEVVVLEAPEGYGSRKSGRVKKLIDSIAKYAESQNLGIFHYSRNKIRFVFNAFDAHTKYEIASAIAENIPRLREKLPEKKKSWEAESYSMSTFDAVSLAITHYYQST